MTAVWVVGIWCGLSAVFLLGWICRGVSIGPCDKCREWKTPGDELGDELVDVRAELAKAEDDLQLAWQAGIMAGQVLQAEREAEGL